MGVLSWIWTMAALSFRIFDVHSSINMLYMIELAGDVFFCILDFIAGIASAAKCNDLASGVKCTDVGDPGKKLGAGCAFMFFTAFLLAGSAFFSFRRWKSSGK